MRGTGPYPEETPEQREERLRDKDERDSYRVKQIIENRDAQGGRMDKAIKLVEWGENSGATWLHIYTTKETHMGLSKFPEGSGGGVEISIYHPSEDDLLCIIKGATEGLMKLHEYNAAKGE